MAVRAPALVGLVAVLLVAAADAQTLRADLQEQVSYQDPNSGTQIQLTSSVVLDERAPAVFDYQAPAVYARWWAEIAACQGVPLPERHTRIRFSAVNARNFRFLWRAAAPRKVRGVTVSIDTVLVWFGPTLGLALVDHDLMIVSITSVFSEARIKHEMTHFLLGWANHAGRSGHPVEFFGTATTPNHCGMRPNGDSSW